MRQIKFLILLSSLICSSAFAYVDLGLQYSFTKRRIEGAEIVDSEEDPGEAITTTETHSLNWAWYIWDYTALELNYSKSTERLVDNRETTTENNSVTINEIDSTVETVVQGAGIRQSFAHRKATFIPSISIGYAKMTTSGRTSYLLDVGGVEDSITLERDKETFNSSYATLQLRIRITQLMGFTLAAKTVMPDFETSDAHKNVTYSAGFSWVF